MKSYRPVEVAIQTGYTEAWIKSLVRRKVVGIYLNGEYILHEDDIKYLKWRKNVLNGGGNSKPKYLNVKRRDKNA